MGELPTWLLTLVGALVVTNIGSIVAIVWAIMKGTWWASKFHTETNMMLAQHGKDINAAHTKLRDHDVRISLVEQRRNG